MLTEGLWWTELRRRGVVGEVLRRVVAELLGSLDRYGAFLRRRWEGQRDRSKVGGKQLCEETLTCGGGRFCFEHRGSGGCC